jgi:CRISPR-associated protein Csy1
MDTPPASDEARALRALIELFIRERAAAKDRGDEPAQADREAWLARAARDAAGLQLVTHTPKFTHPAIELETTRDGTATSLLHDDHDPAAELVSSASAPVPVDVVGNAAGLYLVKFLRLEHAGRTLLERFLSGDPALVAALSDDAERARQWCESFARVAQNRGPPSSHTLARQVYFPVAEGSYHLLAPLYPAGLSHLVYQHVQHHRFSDETKAAREARRGGRQHAGYRDFPNVAVRKFGGTKPQNVSQLNSERGGRAYLFPSCPPAWREQGMKPPLGIPSVFGRWLMRFRPVREPVRALRDFLGRTDYNNLAIRTARAALMDQVCDAVLMLAQQVQLLPAGWSAKPDCRLPVHEALWLDPGRGAADTVFAASRAQEGWRLELSRDFASWLNRELRTERTPMDADAAHEWQREFERALADFDREVGA